MKRETKKSPWIHSFYPVLCWYECIFCNKEFKRERGWKVVGQHSINGVYSIDHVCNNCAKSPDDVRRKLKEREDKFLEEIKKWKPFGGTGVVKSL
jgi:formate-dependent nitrite reductase cytochrome c552 subunit